MFLLPTYPNTNLRATTSNRNGPCPNNVDLGPATKCSIPAGNTLQSTTSSLKLPPSLTIIGHHFSPLHIGTTSVMWALHSLACNNTSATLLNSGCTQLFSPCQSCVKQSHASHSCSQNFELYQATMRLPLLAMRSTVCGPHKLSSHSNTSSVTLQSSWSHCLDT